MTVTTDPTPGPAPHKMFRSVAVLGAGTMGAQIAAHFANAGLAVHLLDIAAPDAAGNKNAIVEKGFKAAHKGKPDPFFAADATARITLGNFDDDFYRVAEVDWVIEVVVERMDIKRSIVERIEKTARPDAVISTNTSGLPIAQIADGRGAEFRRRFLGTHFFNPPRYLKLLEIIPTPDTDPAIVERVAWFGRVHLGKGVVIAKDTPNFIGNRVGVYAMMQALRGFTDGDYTIEEIDAITGPLTGRPKSATFRTADVVGLDVLVHVAKNLYAAVPDDESRAAFEVPAVLQKLVEAGALGAKTGAGFYKKEGKEIRSIDPATAQYTPPAEPNLGDLSAIKKAGDLPARLRALWDDEGRAGRFFRENTLDFMAYAARRIPEIADNPADIDRAMRWGFGWEMGPFEIWDALGVPRVIAAMRERGMALPDWLTAWAGTEGDNATFYRAMDGTREVFVPGKSAFQADSAPADEISLAAIKADASRILWQNAEAALLDLGDGVALFEFRSKANTLSPAVMAGILDAINFVENNRNLHGMVIANEGANFSAGANLAAVGQVVAAGDWDTLERVVADFQRAVLRVRYAAKPVVVATHSLVLGGACELTMASCAPVAAAESYIGLVELGVGLIPAGTGTAHLAWLAAERAPSDFPSHIQPYLQNFFETVAMAKVSTGAVDAQKLGFLPPHTLIVMNDSRRIFAAKQQVLRLNLAGYMPPPVRSHVRVLGRNTHAAFRVALQQYREGNFISDYDVKLASDFAYVLCGGDLTAPQTVHENYLIDLERDVFLKLLGEKNTQARIEHMLKTGKPLRN